MKIPIESLSKPVSYDPDPKYIPGTVLPLISYKDPAKEPEECGRAKLEIEDSALRFSFLLQDSDIFNTARKNNERTWLTGDAAECFFQIAGHRDYYEFHATPEGFSLQLHLESAETLRDYTFEQEICEIGVQVSASKDEKAKLWTAELILPFRLIGLDKSSLNGSRFVCSRYNYTHGKEEPELSASRFFPKGSFHSPADWHIISVE